MDFSLPDLHKSLFSFQDSDDVSPSSVMSALLLPMIDNDGTLLWKVKSFMVVCFWCATHADT